MHIINHAIFSKICQLGLPKICRAVLTSYRKLAESLERLGTHGRSVFKDLCFA